MMNTETKDPQLTLVETTTAEPETPALDKDVREIREEQRATNYLLSKILAAVERVIAQNDVAIQNAVAAGSTLEEKSRPYKEQVDILRYYPSKLEAQSELLLLINQLRRDGTKELTCNDISQHFRKVKGIGPELHLKLATILNDEFLRYAGLTRKSERLFLI